jgi:hypothetical protein
VAIAKHAMAAATVMPIELFEHQKIAMDKLKTGSILCGGVGSGKSRTAIAYYFIKECEGKIKVNGQGGYSAMKKPKDLYIITTAKKRDSLDWEQECSPFLLSTNRKISTCGVSVVIDSWNNIQKYINVKNAFFIFDEQRVVGSGTWVKSFCKITKNNHWILLTATPGDVWMDYVPVFVANGFYKNRTEFIVRHVVYSRFTKYPKIDRYIECDRLVKLKNQIIVYMQYKKSTIAHDNSVIVPFDKEAFDTVLIKRWNIFKNQPIKDVAELCYTLRKVVNSDSRRLDAVKKIVADHPKAIIFYNFDYELDLLKNMAEELGMSMGQWNGHKHEEIPKTEKWIYLVQYSAGAEGWNCIETDSIIFYSQNYSYKVVVQASGRIDRLNTPFSDLYYYHVRSNSMIDLAIKRAIEKKRDFNQHNFMNI